MSDQISGGIPPITELCSSIIGNALKESNSGIDTNISGGVGLGIGIIGEHETSLSLPLGGDGILVGNNSCSGGNNGIHLPLLDDSSGIGSNQHTLNQAQDVAVSSFLPHPSLLPPPTSSVMMTVAAAQDKRLLQKHHEHHEQQQQEHYFSTILQPITDQQEQHLTITTTQPQPQQQQPHNHYQYQQYQQHLQLLDQHHQQQYSDNSSAEYQQHSAAYVFPPPNAQHLASYTLIPQYYPTSTSLPMIPLEPSHPEWRGGENEGGLYVIEEQDETSVLSSVPTSEAFNSEVHPIETIGFKDEGSTIVPVKSVATATGVIIDVVGENSGAGGHIVVQEDDSSMKMISEGEEEDSKQKSSPTFVDCENPMTNNDGEGDKDEAEKEEKAEKEEDDDDDDYDDEDDGDDDENMEMEHDEDDKLTISSSGGNISYYQTDTDGLIYTISSSSAADYPSASATSVTTTTALPPFATLHQQSSSSNNIAQQQDMNTSITTSCLPHDNNSSNVITLTTNSTPASSTKATRSSKSKSSKRKPRRRTPTQAQRKAANVRERKRMYNLNSAFDILRKSIPTFAYEKHLSRIETLRLAMNYISFMNDLLHIPQAEAFHKYGNAAHEMTVKWNANVL